MYDNTSRVFEVNIDEILPNRFQPRIQFDEEEILELSDSIKEHGVIQPIVVRTIGDKYEIIAGERRYKASVLAGKETVPVIIKDLNDKDSAEIALIENVQRKNLTPIEEALSYKKILDMGYITQENLASKLGKSQPSIANKIRLLNLSDEVQEALLENKISERHARSLLKLQTSKEQNDMLNRIINERLTVRRTDEEISKLKNNKETSEESDDSTQKVIERGENNMNNNNLFGMPSIPQNPQPSFDIFGTGNEQVPPTTNFDIFTGTQDVQPAQSVEPQQMNNISMPTFDFNLPPMNSTLVEPVQTVEQPTEMAPAFQTYTAPVETQVASVPTPVETPNNVFNFGAPAQVEPQPVPVSTPVEPSNNVFNFGAPAQVEPQPVPVSTPVEPSNNVFNFGAPAQVEPQPVPVTAPIEEAPNNIFNFEIPTPVETPASPVEAPQMAQNNAFNFEMNNQQQTSTPEFKMPEPIIITDYSKQYDPVMPEQVEPVVSKAEFKEVINAIRECSSKIEQYGYKIDVEEYDLANLYQVIFKVEK